MRRRKGGSGQGKRMRDDKEERLEWTVERGSGGKWVEEEGWGGRGGGAIKRHFPT